jgi:hypothetical protein
VPAEAFEAGGGVFDLVKRRILFCGVYGSAARQTAACPFGNCDHHIEVAQQFFAGGGRLRFHLLVGF